jgi:hypothetical protein
MTFDTLLTLKYKLGYIEGLVSNTDTFVYDSVVGTIEEISAIIDNEPIETNTVAPVELKIDIEGKEW